jgi:type II secretion system protein C
MEFRLSQWHMTALNFLLIAGIAYFSARSVNDIIARRLVTAPAPPAAAAAPHAAGHHPRAYYDVIVKRDIFNEAPQEDNGPPVATTVDLHLKLLGTSLATREKPFAIIEDQTGSQALYRLGDQIPGAGKLVSVEKNRAIVEHGAQRVALDIPASDIPTSSPAAAVPHIGNPRATPEGIAAFDPARIQALRKRIEERGAAKNSDGGDDVDLDVEETSPNHYSLKRDELRNAMNHTAQLMTQIKATPNIQNGKPNGLSISEVEPGSVFEDLGFQDGDLLTSIDGRPIVNPAEAVGLMSALPTRPSVELQVTRDGHPVTLHYDIH